MSFWKVTEKFEADLHRSRFRDQMLALHGDWELTVRGSFKELTAYNPT